MSWVVFCQTEHHNIGHQSKVTLFRKTENALFSEKTIQSLKKKPFVIYYNCFALNSICSFCNVYKNTIFWNVKIVENQNIRYN